MSKHHRFYRPELDVLRALAFCLVFVHHTKFHLSSSLEDFRAGAAFGLCLFFLLSAFLITELLEREFQSTGTIRLKAFYARRILRIWPLYFAILFADFTLMRLMHSKAFTAGHLAAFLLLAGNWFVARHGFVWTWSTPLWSISVEEQFYLLCPFVRRFIGRLGLILFGCAALLIAYLALFLLSRWHANVDTVIWVNSFVQFQFFATGVLLALILKSKAPTLAWWSRCLLAILALSAFYTAQRVFHIKFGMPHADMRMLVPGYLLVNAGCILLLLSFLGASSLDRAKPLVNLGRISYGLYAFHWAMLELSGYAVFAVAHFIHPLRPFLPGLTDILAFALTILVASISYRYFEKPILRFKQRFEVIRTRPA